MTVLQLHSGDPDQETIRLFQGAIGAVKWHNSKAEIKVDSTTRVLQRQGLKQSYQSTCPHMHYDHRCKLIKSDYLTYGKLVVVAFNVITINEAALKSDGYYIGGLLFVNGENRMITGHSGDQITLLSPFSRAENGDECELFAGCDRSLIMCREKFNNLINYGGFPYIPLKNPFQQGLI